MESGRAPRGCGRPLQGDKDPARRLRSDTGDQLEHAKTGDVVARVLRPAQDGEDVLDVAGFQELQAAELDEGDVPPGELDLELARVVRGAEQDRLVAQFHARFPVGQDALDHELDLRGLVRHHGEERPAAARSRLVNRVLGEALAGLGDDAVAGFQDGLGRPVVLFEAHHLGRRIEAVGEIEDVAHRRRAEGVDRLGVVADDGDAGAVGLQTEQDRRLQGVGVLVLIDEDVIEAVGDETCDLADLHHLRPVEQQIVVIEHGLGLLGLDVAGEQALQRLRPFGAPGEGAIERLAAPRAGALTA